QNTGGRCTQQGQFKTRVVSEHSRGSSEHGWSVHTAGTVQNTGGRCTQQKQFRTRGRSVRSTGTVKDTGSLGAQQGQFRTQTLRRLSGTLTAAASSRGLAISSKGPHGGRLLQGPSDQHAGALPAASFSRGPA
ncbi:unnamed protein product, partial [Staurois parvus]